MSSAETPVFSLPKRMRVDLPSLAARTTSGAISRGVSTPEMPRCELVAITIGQVPTALATSSCCSLASSTSQARTDILNAIGWAGTASRLGRTSSKRSKPIVLIARAEAPTFSG
jgi:hypothetical protein